MCVDKLNVRRNNLRYSSERGAIRIGHGLESTLSEKPLTDINSYLTNITPKLEDLKKWSKNDPEREEKSYRQVLFHLYGFGKQAEMLGDKETAEKAKTIINNLIDYNELQKIVQERMANNGSVKISLEDLRPK